MKKLSFMMISLVLAVCMVFSFAACGNDEGGTDPVIVLDAPVIVLDDQTGVITWSAVEHATGYVVFENNKSVKTQSETSYTITQTVEGSYEYMVVATSTDSTYKMSALSNKVTYTVEGSRLPPVGGGDDNQGGGNQGGNQGGDNSGGDNSGGKTDPVQLATPAVTLNQTTGEMTWPAVTGATAYEIYEGGARMTQITGRTFTSPRVVPGDYVYTVRAISSNTESYKASELSEPVTYTVAVKDVEYAVSVTVPTNYTAGVQVALYNGEQTVETKTVTITAGAGSVIFTASNANSYTVGFVSVASNYAGTSATVSAERPTAQLKIVLLNPNSTFRVGSNSFTVANVGDAVGADMFYYFVAEESGTYTVDCSKETKSMYLSVNGTLYIDTANEAYYASFHAEAGALVEICVVGHVSGTFNFEIVKGEIKQYFRIGTEYGNRPNYAYGDCTRYLTVTTPGYYVFECSFASLSGRSLTLTIDGKDYFFGDSEIEGEPINLLQIPLNSGEHEIAVKVTGIGPDDLMPFVAFFIYPAD